MSNVAHIVVFAFLAVLLLYLLSALANLRNAAAGDPIVAHGNYAPAIVRQANFAGLSDLVAHTPLRIGALINDKRINNETWHVEQRVVENEFNSITPNYGYFGTIHPCPPREIVDSRLATTTYNALIHDAAKDFSPCSGYLDYQNPADVDWNIYTSTVEYHWDDYDNAVRWANERGIGVRFHTLFWDFAPNQPTILPPWLDLTTLEVSTQTPDDQKKLARAFLFVMKAHVKSVITHYCANPDDSLNGAIYAIDVMNEVTESNGNIRPWDTETGTPFNWALINLIQEQEDPTYTGDPNAYYIWKAFTLSRDAVSPPTCATPPVLVINDKFPVNDEWDDDPGTPQTWAEGAYNLVNNFQGSEGHYPDLIDGIGIQAHLVITPTDSVPTDPVAGLRGILVQFRNLGVEVQITELDVAILKGTSTPPTPTPTPTPVVPPFDAQAEIYRRVIHDCLYADATDNTYNPICTSITTWGVFDRTSWLACYQPLMFNEGDPYTPMTCASSNPPEPVKVPTADPLYGYTPPTVLVPKAGYYRVWDEFSKIPPATPSSVGGPPGGYPPPAATFTPLPYP